MKMPIPVRHPFLFALCFGWLAVVQAAAAPGDVDVSFQPVLEGSSQTAVSLLPDGAMIVAGQPFETWGGLTKLLPDGTADTSFLPLLELKRQGINVSTFQKSFIGKEGK